jgi:hypothetical protein
MDAPKRIWAWPFNSGWHGGYYRENKHAIPEPEKHGSDYILVSEHDRLMAEKDAEIARLREALLDATAHLIAAAASYRTYARRGGDIRPRAEVDAFFTTRARDYDRAAERARAALGDDNG